MPLGKWSTTNDVIAEASPIELSRLTNSTVIVTGSNTGIGATTAAALLKIGAHVIYACRNVSKAEAAAKTATTQQINGTYTCLKLDLSSLQSIRDFVAEYTKKSISKSFKPLSCLVLNAGLVSNSSQHKTQEGLEITFGVNHIGHYYLTNLLLPELRKNAPSRVVVVSSDSHYKGLILRTPQELSNVDLLEQKVAYGFDEKMMRKYGSSKLANVLFSQHLHEKEKGNGIVSASLHPGSMISTDIAARNGWIQTFVAKYLLGMFTKNPDQGAATTLYVCLLPQNELEGQYFDHSVEKKSSALTLDDPGARNARLALETLSQKLSKL